MGFRRTKALSRIGFPNCLTDKPKLVCVFLFLFLWAFLIVLFAGQAYLTSNQSWEFVLWKEFRFFAPWLVLCPAIVWLAKKFRFGKETWRRSLAIHVAASIVVIFLTGAISLVAVVPFIPEKIVHKIVPPGDMRRAEKRAEKDPAISDPAFQTEGSDQIIRGKKNRQAPARNFTYLVPMALFEARLTLPLYWILVGIVNAVRFYSQSMERNRAAAELETRLAEAKLAALQMQIRPHFLFNTLNGISTLLHTDPEAADEMIGNLSELLRLSLASSTQHEIPLRTELDFLDTYLKIQKARFADRLEVKLDIEYGTGSIPVPSLILQPLVENALRHGIEPSANHGRIHISAKRMDGGLELRVEDNGTGLQDEPSGPKENEGGIGLANTRARLEALYGSEARLELINLEQGGLAATMWIPYRYNAPQEVLAKAGE